LKNAKTLTEDACSKWRYFKKEKMNRLTRILLLTFITASCYSVTNKTDSNVKINNPGQKVTIMNDTTPKVTGIGGIFFRSKNPVKAREWYSKNLGLAISEYGSTFESRNVNRPDEINYLQWSPFDEGTDYFKPSEKEFMINYRVQNIEGLVKKLRKNGVTILDEIEKFEYGKFIHILDAEGNKIELWEPVDSVLTQTGGATTK
jgi:predicted enzyme related to lactoylglutathione lyase